MPQGYIVDDNIAELVRELTANDLESINPMQDKYGRWFISVEEYNNPAFRHILNILDNDEPVTIYLPARKLPGT